MLLFNIDKSMKKLVTNEWFPSFSVQDYKNTAKEKEERTVESETEKAGCEAVRMGENANTRRKSEWARY